MSLAKRRFREEMREMPGGPLGSIAWVWRRYWPLLVIGFPAGVLMFLYFVR